MNDPSFQLIYAAGERAGLNEAEQLELHMVFLRTALRQERRIRETMAGLDMTRSEALDIIFNNYPKGLTDSIKLIKQQRTDDTIRVGNKVSKKSRKKFQNGEKIATVQMLTWMTIPCSHSQFAKEKGWKTVDAVLLDGCLGAVRLSKLKKEQT